MKPLISGNRHSQPTRQRRRRLPERPISLEALETRRLLSSVPVVQSVLPPSSGGTAAGGGEVRITGSDFEGVTAVTFGGTPATILSKSSTALTVTQPALQVGFHDVTVTTPAGTSALTMADQYLVDPLAITITNDTGLPSNVPISVGIFAQVAYDKTTGLPINRPLNATGAAIMAGEVGQVGSLTILAAGEGYAPTVTIHPPLSGKQATAEANGFDKAGGVTSFAVQDAGSGYGQIVTVSAPPAGPSGAGTTAEAYADIDASGAITNFTITNSGSGYQTAFTVDGGTAKGYAIVDSQGQITGATITDAGPGYTFGTSPSVTFYGGGKGAIATGKVTAGGTISGLDITAGGSDYFYAPTITLAQGNGAVVDVAVNPAAGIVQSMGVTHGGSGYGPLVTVTGSGTGLAAAAVITNNTVASVVPLTGKSGQGYLPSLTFSAPGGGGQTATGRVTALDGKGGIATVTIDNPGSGYTTQPSVMLTGSGSEGSLAAKGAASVTGVQIVNPGFGYDSKSLPGVVFTGGGNYPTPAVATASVADGGVASIAVSKGGDYFSAPTVTIDPPPSGDYDLEWVGFNTAGQFAPASSLKTEAGNLPTFPLDFTSGPASITMPQIFTQATRIVFGVNSPPVLPVQSDGTVSAPNMSNPTDPNHTVVYDFIEYTLNQSNILYIDTSSVDQFGFPMTMTIAPADPVVPDGVGTLVSRGVVFGSTAQGFAAYLDSLGQSAVDAFGTLPTQQGTTTIADTIYPYRIIAPQDLLQLGEAPTPLTTWFDTPLQTLYDATTREMLLVVPNPNAGISAGNTTNWRDADRANYFFTGTPQGQAQGIEFKGVVNGAELALTIPAYTSSATPTTDVFAAQGIFAPGPTDDTLVNERHLENNLLGNIKNQVASAVNRGIVNLTKSSSPASFANHLGMGVVAATVADGGSGYTLAPAVTFSPPPAGPNAATAQGVAVVSGGSVTGVIITDPGNGYDPGTPVTVTFSPPQATGVTATGGTMMVGLVDTTAWVGTQTNSNLDHLPFYAPGSVSNWYAGYFHSSVGGQPISRQNLAYAFPYDDQGNQSSTMSVANPTGVAVTLGPWGEVAPTSPSVRSIDTVPPRQGDLPTPTDAASVSWIVTFSEPVKGVTSQNFSLAASGVAPGPITAVTPNGTGEYSLTWTVQAGTGTGSGTLGLNLANGTGIVDAAGETILPATFTGQVYSVRPTPVGPTAMITIPGTNPTSAAAVPFTVSFSEAVTGLTTANFTPVAGGGVSDAAVQSVTGSGTTWTVITSTGTGSGTLALQLLAPGTGITPTPTGLPVTSPPYSIVAAVPQVSLAPTTFTIEQDGPRQVALDFTTASFTDPAGLPADTVYTVKMTGSGTIQATSTGGVTFRSLGGGVYEFDGTLTNLDTYFKTPDRILYIPPLGSRTPTSPSFHGTRQLAVTLIRPTDDAASDPVTLTIVVQPNQPPVIQAPLTFVVTLDVQTPIVWPATMTPFADASAESLTVTLAVPTGVLAAASSGGVTVSGSTDIEKQFVGSVSALNAYFKAANISYTATGTTSQSRPLAITASDGAAHSEATSTIVVHNPTPDPNGPPTINPTTVLEWATENQWFEITYDQLVAASGASDPAHRTVEFTLAAINSGTLQMYWHGIWIPAPTPRFGQAPPVLVQGGKLRWFPPENTVSSTGQLAFTVGLFDLKQRSLGTSQVFIKIRP